MATNTDLTRFLEAQERSYATALAEVKAGRKTSHWMWYIFPQLKGLGHSDMARFYGITDLKEAADFLDHPVLGTRLIEITRALLQLPTSNALQVLGSPDHLKLQSSMTLFAQLNTQPAFQAVLEKFYDGEMDRNTLRILGRD